MKIPKIREKNNVEELTNIFENQNKLVHDIIRCFKNPDEFLETEDVCMDD